MSGNEVTCSPVISEFGFLHQAHVDYYSKENYISCSLTPVQVCHML